MVGANRLKAGHSGQQRLAATAVAGEVVGHDPPGQHLHTGLKDTPTEKHRRTGARGSQTLQAIGILTIMGYTSDTRGHAMKAADPVKAFGSVIGKALRALRDGQGLIPILIALQ